MGAVSIIILVYIVAWVVAAIVETACFLRFIFHDHGILYNCDSNDE